MVGLALRPFAKGNVALPVSRKKDMSEADCVLEFLGLAIGYRGNCNEVKASLSLPKETVEKLVAFARALRGAGAAS